MKFGWTAFTLGLGCSVFAGCGYTEQEWRVQLDKFNRLQTDHQKATNDLVQVQTELHSVKQKVADLTKQLEAAGVDLTKLSSSLDQRNTELSKVSASLEEREKALAEYKARARQLELIKARFEMLRQKLDELTRIGLAVNIRRNRMVISLPGDVLFDTGRETLRKEGKDILKKVAQVIQSDSSLMMRDYQVVGHTDNKPLKGGPFRDNWGLSLMRAREVLLYLIDAKQGALPFDHWSASGMGETDPIAANDSNDGRQMNRRCELVVMPSVEEMLDLKALAQAK